MQFLMFTIAKDELNTVKYSLQKAFLLRMLKRINIVRTYTHIHTYETNWEL